MAEPEAVQLPEAAAPDVMNDPQFDTNNGAGEDGMGDADTCRICRGEGGDSEPLFHPCKCSGSIKYVHQDCLMEWLSHSQKKHCELCKTPFRFTKLYSPNMPQSLPLPVLIRHVLIHIAKTLATWSRACVVIIVWLMMLPYIIRQVWRVLFWFSDGGSSFSDSRIHSLRNATSTQALEMVRELSTLPQNGTSPVNPFEPAPTTSASIGGIVEKFFGFFVLNGTGFQPLSASVFKSMYYGLGIQSVTIPENTSDNIPIDFTLTKLSTAHSPTLLSEISWLRNLTRSDAVNRITINIAEGYIITICVVVSFILIFLIREWVVQQRPQRDFDARHPDEQNDAQEPPAGDIGAIEAAVNNFNQNRPERPIAPLRRRNNAIGDIPPQPGQNNPDENVAGPSHNENGGPSTSRRPSPPREALSAAAEIQRQLTEEPSHTEEFLAIWRRADSDPQEVLRIIEREDKSEDMRYWVNAMNLLQNPGPRDNGRQLPDLVGDDALPESDFDGATLVTPNDRGLPTDNDGSRASSESWVQVGTLSEAQKTLQVDSNDIQAGSHREEGKGKAKESYASDEESSGVLRTRTNGQAKEIEQKAQKQAQKDAPSPETTSRPRAVSDGPQRKDTISPLANNNWSFSNLTDDPILPEDKTETSVLSNADNSAPFDLSDYVPLRSLLDPQSPEGLPGSLPVNDHLPPLQSDADSEEADLAQGPVTITSQDGTNRTYQSISDAFDANPVESDSETEADRLHNAPQANPFHPDVPLPSPQEPLIPLGFDAEAEGRDEVLNHSQPNQAIVPHLDAENDALQPLEEPHGPLNAPPAVPQGLLGHVADFFWGGIGDDGQNELGGNDEQIVQNIAEEAPFVPVAHEDPFDQPVPEQDREVIEAAIAAGIDPLDQDAIEEAEDFEGIMELVGMRGPIFSLVQNALFSAFLLSLTVATGLWIPYNIGRVFLLLLANPGPALKLPLRLIYSFAAISQDVVLSFIGMISYALITLCSLILDVLSSSTSKGDSIRGLGSAAMMLSHNSTKRVFDGITDSLVGLTESEIFAFSAASHEALNTIQSCVIENVAGLGAHVRYLFTGYSGTSEALFCPVITYSKQAWQWTTSLPSLLSKPDSWVISLEVSKRTTPLDLDLSAWSGWDRFWAIFGGYAALFILGALYVKKGKPFSNGRQAREWEGTVLDLLRQAGGVMKVILIISIEMLVFPLYCGLLLDAALLPLFDNATVMSRILFTVESPCTSIFVHWFVGTCYMFHFALFVSMCRKIMRTGVLYFIRDPDDPTFHPVRDVLERNVATQLRKILFSALVYGALVVICLGGVVWGLAFACKGVLPIHWSSNEPVLEFPIDLLFYNFLMPMAVRFFKPSDGLHSMYRWWFRQCARMLRLTWFMFDERKIDEEGHHVRRNWTDLFRGVKGDPSKPVTVKDRYKPFEEDPELMAYFRFDGKYVRAPASDQVRIPKGGRIFLEVDLSNSRIDGKEDKAESLDGISSEHYKQVYIPPYFRFRIFLFILYIWLFAAATGVGITIVPLVFGRHIFAKIIPPYVRKNDVYAFSIGIYILGTTLYFLLNLRKFLTYLQRSLAITAETPHNVLRRLTQATTRIASIAWTYSAFLFLLPTLFALVVEFYAIVPLHTYFAVAEPHVVHFVQSWTLGLLYVKLTTRIILWHENSRPAQGLRAITRNGYLNPDARLATRTFILPASVILLSALSIPWALARLGTTTVFKAQPEKHFVVYRYAYPFSLALLLAGAALVKLVGMAKKWRMMIRDEVYLIGERLHNFGDRKVGSGVVGAGVVVGRRLDT